MTAPVPEHLSIRVMSTLALMGVMDELAPGYEALTRTKIASEFAPTNTLLRRIGSGEKADLAILTAEAIERLTREGVLLEGSRVDLAVSVVGIAVRAGAPRPAIGSADEFRRALLDAKSIAYSAAGASGIFFAGLIERLGIAEQVNAKATVIPAGLTGELVAGGKAEVAVQQISELMVVPGIDIVGPLPPGIEGVALFSGAMFAGAEQPEAGMAFLRFLATPEAAPVFASKGLKAAGHHGTGSGTAEAERS
jgi:molybdate transport system substrate-binding protein